MSLCNDHSWASDDQSQAGHCKHFKIRLELFQRQRWGNFCEGQGGVRMGFSELINTILNWSELRSEFCLIPFVSRFASWEHLWEFFFTHAYHHFWWSWPCIRVTVLWGSWSGMGISHHVHVSAIWLCAYCSLKGISHHVHVSATCLCAYCCLKGISHHVHVSTTWLCILLFWVLFKGVNFGGLLGLTRIKPFFFSFFLKQQPRCDSRYFHRCLIITPLQQCQNQIWFRR